MNLQNILSSNVFTLFKKFWITVLDFLCNTTMAITSAASYVIINFCAVFFSQILNFVFRLAVKMFCK